MPLLAAAARESLSIYLAVTVCECMGACTCTHHLQRICAWQMATPERTEFSGDWVNGKYHLQGEELQTAAEVWMKYVASYDAVSEVFDRHWQAGPAEKPIDDAYDPLGGVAQVAAAALGLIASELCC